jgi:hypothetical protein
MLGKCIYNTLCTLAECTQRFLKGTPRCVCCMCVCQVCPVLASAMMAALVLRPWAHVSVRGGRERRRIGTEGDGDVVPFRSHLAGTEKGEREGRWRSAVTVSAMKQGRGSRDRRSGLRRRR